MALNAGTAFVDVLPNTSKFHGLMSTSMKSSTSQSKFSGIGKVAGLALLGGIGIALGGLAKLASSAIEAAQEAVQVEAQTEAVLKSTGQAAKVTEEDIARLTETIMGYAAISDETIRSGANLLLTFTNIRNEVGKGNDIFDQTTRIMTDMSVALGQDMKSSAIQLGKALNDPIRGITALRRVGVSFTEAQEKQIKKLIESGQLMKAQKIILRELTTEFGGSARKVGDTRPWDKLKLAVGEVMEAIGKALLPTVNDLAQRLLRFVRSDQFKDWMEAAGKFLRVNLPKAMKIAGDAFKVIAPIIREVAGYFRGLWQMVANIVDALKALAKIDLGEFFSSGKGGGLSRGGFPFGGLGTGTPGGSSLVSIGQWLQASGFRVSGHPAFPPVGGHTAGSYHYIGRAIDVNWGPAGGSPQEHVALAGVAAKIAALFGGRILESLGPWNDAAHGGNNMHWHLAMDRGGIVKGPATIHQGNITEAHIPLTGPGARGLRIAGTLNTSFGPAEIEATVVDVLRDGEIVNNALDRAVWRR